MTHLDDETLRAANANLAAAARMADRALTGPVTVPSFDALLGAAVAARRAAVIPPVAHPAHPAHPEPPTRLGLRRALRLAVQIVTVQTRLLPRVLPLLTVVGLVVAVGLAYAVSDRGWRGTGFGAVVSLLVLAGGLAACTPDADPRRECMMVLPVSPRVVFLARLVLILAVDVASALLASVAASVLERPGGIAELVSSWLGPSLLSASVAVVVAIWRTYWLGSFAGILVWFFGVAATLPQRRVSDVGVGAVLDRLWASTPVTVGCALVLLAVAVRLVSDPRRIAGNEM